MMKQFSLLQEISDDDSLIQVPGYGQLRVSQIKRRIQDMLNEASKLARSGQKSRDWKNLEAILKKDTLHAFVRALEKFYEENYG